MIQNKNYIENILINIKFNIFYIRFFTIKYNIMNLKCNIM